MLKSSSILIFVCKFLSIFLVIGVGVLEGPLYAVGGHDGWSYLNTVERWDPQASQWSYVAPMSSQRSTVGVAVLNNKYENVLPF